MITVAYILVGISVFIVVYGFFQVGNFRKGNERPSSNLKSKSLILRLTLPLTRSYLLPSVRNLKIENFRKEKKNKILSAGLQDELTPDEFLSLKIFLAIILPFVAFVYNLSLNVANPLVLVIIFGFLGYFFPDAWLMSLIKDRQIKIRMAIPFVIDLLSLCTEAGLDFMQAIQRVVEKAKKSPLIEELETVLRELKLGTTRVEALHKMANRINMTEISSIVAVLVTADQMGTSISSVLKAQADQLRSERFVHAEKEGAKASQKILFPLIFFIVPAVFIVVLGPLIAKLLQQLFSGGFSGFGGGFLE